ncbi:MAG: glycogen/starch/alpha-glucan phosphorylase [Candidatus Omnitrophica bacterium]|nr:glycogen/starch/alpha-glucan phosphorylase [Candidatus Omnitrophota bacterium]MDD5488421.1 glycogen/starch/alpha-glucan phosphorylase [Candidatus Omnitrophota bacterium]
MIEKKDTQKIVKADTEDLKEAFMHNRRYALAKDIYTATDYDNFKSLAIAIRDRIIEKWILTQQLYHAENCKRVYYLSLEFLLGRLLGNNIMNLGLENTTTEALSELGYDLEDLRDKELDAGLGNGGLGRLAACFLDSMATLGIAATGYGIRYDYGIFNQKIIKGWQVEYPDEWLRLGNPWEFERPEYTIKVKFYGKTVKRVDKSGRFVVDWVDTKDVLAMAYDTPVSGYKNGVVNNLRLWSARSTEEFDLEYFNDGDYMKALEQKIFSENISRVLYPSDNVYKGMELRLKQEYFFTSASIYDIIRRFKVENKDFSTFPDKVAIQLNDTHPAVSIVELMRIFLDEEELDWDTAWGITTRTFAYTNHTIMPEALETWPISLFGKLLPRHLDIIYEINMRFMQEVASRYPHDKDKLRRMSLIEEGPDKKVRMSNLSVVGSHSVNGVSKLHTELLKTRLFADFYDFWPDKFNAKTNGITQRRWLKKANTRLTDLVTETIGDDWCQDLSQMKKLIPFADDAAFRKKWRKAKLENKKELAGYVKTRTGLVIDPDSMVDVQVKRIHEYKRQTLFALYLISAYLKIKNGDRDIVPRTAIIGGKAAPGYLMAKLVIKFINNIANVINNDPETKDKLRVVFLENYRVSLAEKIFPASDLSEQISTAGTEASGTGNMKFMLNGAVTIGTLDGANVEIAEEVGPENIFIFGLKAHEVQSLEAGGYDPRDYIRKDPHLAEVMKLIQEDFFSQFEPGVFKPLVDSLALQDKFKVCADFADYIATQERVSAAFLDKEEWTKRSILNTANSGRFSSDRTIANYADEIWKVPYGRPRV